MTFPPDTLNDPNDFNQHTEQMGSKKTDKPNSHNPPNQPYQTQALLPPNASQTQRDLVEACYLEPLMAKPMAYLQQLRHAPSAAVLKHRLWESGLESVHQWIKDPQQALEWGQHWRHLLGTPQSVYIALNWLGINQARLHEGTPGEHFYEVRLELNTRSNRYLEATKLTQYCLPVRCRLRRVYNGQARGPLILGDAKQGLMKATLLQAEPGITIAGFGDIRFSFVQTHDPSYRLALQYAHSQQSEFGFGHYGNAFHLLGIDLLGQRQGLSNGVSHWLRISARMHLNANEAQRESQYSFWHLRFHSPLTLSVSESRSHQHHLARGQAQQGAARGTRHFCRPRKGLRPLHFNHFEDSLCQAH